MDLREYDVFSPPRPVSETAELSVLFRSDCYRNGIDCFGVPARRFCDAY